MKDAYDRVTAGLGLVTGAVTCMATAWLLAHTAASAWSQVRQPAPDPDEGIALVAALAGLGICAWLAMATTLTAIAAAITRVRHTVETLGPVGRRLHAVAEAVTPPTIRRVVSVVAGVTLVAGAVPAQAASGSPTRAEMPSVAWFQDAPAVSARASSGPGSPSGHPGVSVDWVAGSGDEPAAAPGPLAPPPTVVVQPGDTLWSVAAAHLPPGPDRGQARAIASAWPLWFAANRQVIGPDPDQIIPGQRLVDPGSPRTDGS